MRAAAVVFPLKVGSKRDSIGRTGDVGRVFTQQLRREPFAAVADPLHALRPRSLPPPLVAQFISLVALGQLREGARKCVEKGALGHGGYIHEQRRVLAEIGTRTQPLVYQ